MRSPFFPRIQKHAFITSRFWLLAIILLVSISCSFPGLISRAGKSEELSKKPDLPTEGEYYGDKHPSQPGGWTYDGNCRYSEGIRLWMDTKRFVYTQTAVCGSGKESKNETWTTTTSGTDKDPYGTIFAKGMIYSLTRKIIWTVSANGTSDRVTTLHGLIGKLSTDLSEVELCKVEDQGAAFDEESLLYTFENYCDNISFTINLSRVD